MFFENKALTNMGDCGIIQLMFYYLPKRDDGESTPRYAPQRETHELKGFLVKTAEVHSRAAVLKR